VIILDAGTTHFGWPPYQLTIRPQCRVRKGRRMEQPPTGTPIAGALFDATRTRLLRLLLRPARVRAAFGAMQA